MITAKPFQTGRCQATDSTHKWFASRNQTARSLTHPLLRLVMLVLAVVCLGTGSSLAAPYSWSSTSPAWVTPGNWAPPGPPGLSDDANFLGGGTPSVDLNNGGSGNSVDTIMFNAATPNYYVYDSINLMPTFTDALNVGTSITKNGANTISLASLLLNCPTLTVNSGGFDFIGTNIVTLTTANINGGIVCVSAFPPSLFSAANWNVNGGTFKVSAIGVTSPSTASSVIGNVIVSGGTFVAGCSVGTANIYGNVSYGPGGSSDFELSAANVVGSNNGDDLINVEGNLTLDGTINVIGLPGFGPGIYRLYNYSGAFANNGVALGNVPSGYTAQLDFNTPNQVNMLVFSATNCCSAPCYPTNQICYTNIVYPGYNYLVNHLCHYPNNSLGQLIPNPLDGSMILKWNPPTQSYEVVATYDSGFGGWYDDAFNPADNVLLNPGEGFVLFNPGASYSLIICGCLPTCPPPCLTNTTGFVLVGRRGVGPAYWTNLSSCPLTCGTTINTWNPATQDFTTYTYGASGWSPSTPVIGIGQSVFVKMGTETNCTPPCTNNLVINGSFETPAVGIDTAGFPASIPGWTSVNSLNNPAGFELWSGNSGSMAPQHGYQHLEIDSSTYNMTVSQVITNASPNCPARFCFWYTGRPGYSDNTFKAEVVGSGLGPVTLNPAQYNGSNWVQYCVDFVPTSTTLTIKFTGLTGTNPAGAHIDNVTLMQCCTNTCNEPLVVNCSTNKTVNCGSAWQFNPPTATSPCCGTNLTISVISTFTNGVCPKVAKRIWKVTDCFNHSLMCTQTVTMVDTTPPVVMCPPKGITQYVCSTSSVVYFKVYANDACSGKILANCNPPSGYNFPAGTTIVTATAVDACGNVGTCTFPVTVVNQSIVKTVTLGKADCFKKPNENAPKSAKLLAAHPGAHWKKFDGQAINRPFGVSFMGLPKNLTCAQLTIRMKPNCLGGSPDDTISIGLTPANAPVWTSYIGGGQASPGLTTNFWCSVGNCGQTFVLNLASMPNGGANLLPSINALGQLDIYVVDDTAVDYVSLTYCYCPSKPGWNGYDWDATNAEMATGNQFTFVQATNPNTNFGITLTPGAAHGIRVGTELDLGSISNASFTAATHIIGDPENASSALKLTSTGDGKVNLSLPSLSPSVTDVRVLLSMNGIVEEMTNWPVAQLPHAIVIMEDGPMVKAITATDDRFIVSLASPVHIRECPLCPPPLANQVTIILSTPSRTPDNMIESLTLNANGLSEFPVGDIATRVGRGWAKVIGNGQASIGDDQLSLVTQDTSPTNRIGIGIHLPVTNRVSLSLGAVQNAPANAVVDVVLFNIGSSGQDGVEFFLGSSGMDGEIIGSSGQDGCCLGSSGQDGVSFYNLGSSGQDGFIGNIGSSGQDGVALNLGSMGQDGVALGTRFTQTNGTWIIGANFSPIGSSQELYQVYNHGVLVASLTTHGYPHVPVLPPTLSVADSGAQLIIEWASDEAITINGTDYVGNELRISAVSPNVPLTGINYIGLGSSGQDGVSIATVRTPGPNWLVQPPQIEGDEASVEWTGPAGGALESAPTVTGPWTVVPTQSGQSATISSPSTNGVPAQYFRIRSN